MNYKEQLLTLQNAMVHGDKKPMLALIKPARHNVCTPQTRLAVYTNGYTIRLEEAVDVDYPALKHYLGKEAFEKAAAAYVNATPSVFWDLNLYSIGFAEFIRTNIPSPLWEEGYALARLESALTEVFWLPDSTPLGAEQLSALSMDALAQQIFHLRPAGRLLALSTAANAYFTAFREGNPPAAIEHTPEYLFIVRLGNTMRRMVLEKEEYHLLSRLAQGMVFGDALELVENPELLVDKLPGYLARWLDSGFFADLS